MPYEILATQNTPALIIYLLDVSGSMAEPMLGVAKITRVNTALEKLLIRMVRRSTRGEFIAARYRLAMISYSSTPKDLIPGVATIDVVARRGTPQLEASRRTDTALAFSMAREILRQELPRMRGCPAPMICHLTDGEYTGDDPEPIAREIMEMHNDDGHVLIENIYLGEGLLNRPIEDIERWTGVRSSDELANPHTKKLFNISSALPETYAEELQEGGYALQAGARMLLPAESQDLIELAFAMSGATPVR